MKMMDYSNLLIESDTGIYFAGISYFPIKTTIIDDDTVVYSTEVALNENYRPDKVADRIWQIPDLAWVLDIINDFPNGIKEYTKGTTIQYVSLDRLRKIGII